LIAITFLISGYSLSFLIFFKFLLHLLGCLFFYKILQYFKIRGILLYVGVFLYMINPAWQLYSRVFLSEPITLFFITIFLWSLLKFLKTGKQLWLNGLIGGMVILVHPYYIFLPFSIWAFLFLFKKLQFKQILFLGGMAIFIVSLWVIRNSVVLETDKLLITTSSGAVMAKGWNEKVPQLHTNTKGDLAEEELVLQNFEYSNSNYQGHTGSMQLYQDATYYFIRSNPELILPIIWKKLKSAFNPFPETPRPGILETGRVIYHFLALVAALFLLWQGSKIVRTLVLGLFLSTIFITILTYSGFRFRMPQSGMEILFVVSAIHLLIGRRKLYNFKREL
jgi:hypothetical protein